MITPPQDLCRPLDIKEQVLWASAKASIPKSKNKSFLCSMGKMYTAFQFLKHLRLARRWDAFHSPYLFDLFTACCDESKESPAFQKIEFRRRALLSSKEQILRLDYGAGSVSEQKNQVSPVAQIAKNALSRPFQCRFLFRLVEFLKPRRTLEFGTSLGISTAYMSAGCSTSAIDTVEGDPEVAKIASVTFNQLGCKNITLYPSRFQDYIDRKLDQKEKIDLFFLDGHHTAKALLHYYNALKPRIHSNTIIVVDDIYWSKDMNGGWFELINYPEVTQSVDCFHFGLIFLNNDFIGKENHKIRLPIKMMLA